MFIRVILFFSILFFRDTCFLRAQTNPDYEFLLHLTEENKNREALYLLDQGRELSQVDTLNYLKGMNYYYLKRADSAALFFNQVSPTNALHTRSRFFAALNLMYAKKYEEALTSFSTFSEDTLMAYGQMVNLVLAGNCLLLRDYKRFDSLSAGFLFDDHRTINEQQRLIALKKEVLALKKKSPVVAGLLSAVVPGLGKFYAGRKGAAMAAFAASAALAAVSLEVWYRGGPSATSPQFITAASLFTFFYAGNIVGSIHSVKQQNRSVNGRVNNEILANIHISIIRVIK